jgi:hypothetical protein
MGKDATMKPHSKLRAHAMDEIKSQVMPSMPRSASSFG